MDTESPLRAFVDELLSGMPLGKIDPAAIAEHWQAEIDAALQSDSGGELYAPDQYTLSMHPRVYDVLTGSGAISQDSMSKSLQAALDAAGYRVVREPHITLATDPTLPRHKMRVIAWHGSRPVSEEDTETPPQGAYFVVDGARSFVLDLPLVNMGRHLDNQLVLEDPHISRRHAQLRLRRGRYVVYDLNSTAGTRVNGKEVREWVLQPGDVMMLGTTQLIYYEDEKGPPPSTPAYEPPQSAVSDPDRVTPTDMATMEISEEPGSTKEFDRDA